MMTDLEKVEVKSLKELRRWLQLNHKQKNSVWLVTYKIVEPKFYIEYPKIVDELLCFGWIDSLPRKLDEQRKMLRISPRKPKSAWSKINRDKVPVLIESGQMNPAGLEVIEQAKKDGSWDKLKVTDENKIPKDLNLALKKHSSSLKNFKAFPPSARRAILEWIAQAKAPETRNRRLSETALLAKKNIRANSYVRKAPKVQKSKISTLGRSVQSDLLNIPGIGKTFVKDFERIKIQSQKDLKNKKPELLFKKLVQINEKLGHKTSKNYLYVIRMAIYYAQGGREVRKLKWSFWKA